MHGGWQKLATCPAETPCRQQGDAFGCFPMAATSTGDSRTPPDTPSQDTTTPPVAPPVTPEDTVTPPVTPPSDAPTALPSGEITPAIPPAGHNTAVTDETITPRVDPPADDTNSPQVPVAPEASVVETATPAVETGNPMVTPEETPVDFALKVEDPSAPTQDSTLGTATPATTTNTLVTSATPSLQIPIDATGTNIAWRAGTITQTGTATGTLTSTGATTTETNTSEIPATTEIPLPPVEPERPSGAPTVGESVRAPASAPLTLNWKISPEAEVMKHRVTYLDWNVLGTEDPDPLPLPANLKGYNRLMLSFFMVTRPEGKPGAGTMGPIDKAQIWSEYSAETRKKLKAEYKAAGVSVMVSAFGATGKHRALSRSDMFAKLLRRCLDSEVAKNGKAAEVAAALAKFVKDYDLDGVDVDFEDVPTEASLNWVIGTYIVYARHLIFAEGYNTELQTALRVALPSPQYLISHAPQAPWFDTTDRWAKGYRRVHEEVGTSIDFYNVSHTAFVASRWLTSPMFAADSILQPRREPIHRVPPHLWRFQRRHNRHRAPNAPQGQARTDRHWQAGA